jgi:ABC-type sugar transport system ATPase subunit
MNFVPGKLVSAEARQAKVALADGTKVTVAVDATRANAGEDVTLGARPEHFVLDGSAPGVMNKLRGEVVLVENLGESALIYLKLPKIEALTLCRTEGTSSAKEGEVLELGLPARAAHLFDASGKSFPRTVDDALEGTPELRAS